MPRLTGRTFGDIIEKGDYDAEARAALTADDLCAALIRWVVDIYHRLPHDGLDGEAPIDCWNRLVAKWGVSPAPDLRRRRIAFGTGLKRTVSRTGITVQGIRYHETFLAHWFKDAKDPTVNVRWYKEDLGAIEVQLKGNGKRFARSTRASRASGPKPTRPPCGSSARPTRRRRRSTPTSSSRRSLPSRRSTGMRSTASDFWSTTGLRGARRCGRG
jgi:hypothetical protein